MKLRDYPLAKGILINFKSISYVIKSALFFAVLTLFLGLVGVNAQILPPNNAHEWSNVAGTTDFDDAANWVGGAVPPSEAELLFANAPSGQHWDAKEVNNALADRKLRSLWFETGFDYTFSGEALWLGDTLEDGGRLITVLNRSGWHSEVTFENAIHVTTENSGYRFLIHNESLGGLRFNGDFNTGGHSIQLEGDGPIRFSGAISGASGGGEAGEMRVAMGAGHVVFTGNNSAWGGTIHVDSGMAVVSANGALGSAAVATTVADGATLAFRQQNWGGLGPSVNYLTGKTIEIVGDGIWRAFAGRVGALYNDGGNNRFDGNVVLLGDASAGSRANWLWLSGAVTGSGSFTKVGKGLLALTNAGNAYTGATIIKEGGLWIADEAALQGGFGNTNTGTNIVLDGGVLVLPPSTSNWNESFTRQIGTGAGQIQWTGSGGFSAAEGGSASLRLTNEHGVEAGMLTWGQGGFVPFGSALVFGTEWASGLVSLRNSIDFAGGLREINVHRDTIAEIIAAAGFNNGGVIKTGQGRIMLRGDHNYTGPTVILDGLFEEVARVWGYDVQTNYQLGGGTLGLSALLSTGIHSPMLGTGADQVQWLAGSDGGLAIMGGQEGTIRINGSQAEITWGQQYFVGLDNTLILGHRESSVGHIWDTALDLAGGERTIHVVDSVVMSAAQRPIRAEFKFTQALRNGSLRLVGDGRLDMTVPNDELKGSVTVSGAELRLNEAGTLKEISGLRIERAGTVTLDNAGTYNAATGGAYLSDRLRDGAAVTLDAGALRFWGTEASGSTSSETIGALTLAGGANTIDVVNRGDSASVATLNLASLSRSSATATINFTNSAGVGTYSGVSGTGPRLRFATAPSLSGGILPYATVHGSDWATVTTDGYLVAYSGYHIGGASTWAAAHNVSIHENLEASGALTINSLRFGGSWQAKLADSSTTLNIVSGGILAAHSSNSRAKLDFGRLTTAADNLYIHIVNEEAYLDISSEIWGNIGLVKSGRGNLILYGPDANTFTGTTWVQEGILVLQKLLGVDAIAGDIVVGDFKGADKLMLLNSHQIADTVTVTLRGVQHTQPIQTGGFREGILQLNNGPTFPGIREAFHRLHIEGRGVLDFNGGEIGRANYLFLNRLTFADTNSQLIIRRWVEYGDYLLVRRSGNESLIPPILSQIWFDGYGPARWIPYDNDFWQITPAPEPATYGAILGAVGGGLFAWRKRKRRACTGPVPKR